METEEARRKQTTRATARDTRETCRDAYVAMGGGGRCSREQDAGDASVPTTHNSSPAPTDTKSLPRRGHTIPTLESTARGWRMESSCDALCFLIATVAGRLWWSASGSTA